MILAPTKYQHYNTDLERCILGICILQPAAFTQAQEIISTADCFYDPDHRIVWDTMMEMQDRGEFCDMITVTQRVAQKKSSSVIGDVAYFITHDLCMGVYSDAHLTTWCVSVNELYMNRLYLEVSQIAGSSPDDIIEATDALNEKIEKAKQIKASDDWHSIGQAMFKLQQHMDVVRSKNTGVLSGIQTLDDITFGFQPGQLIVLAARPAVGKSAFAASVALNTARKGNKVGIISLEMPEEQLAGRMAAIYSDMEFWRIYRNVFNSEDEERIFYTRSGEMAGLPIYFTDKTNVNAAIIRGKAMKLKNKKGLDFLIIDYLQLIETEGKRNETREREIAKLSRSLKLLSLELNIPIMVLAQLNRESEKSADKKPKAHNLRESGSIEQDADLILLLHRDYAVGIEEDANGNSTKNEADIIIAKHRNGETAELKLGFDGFRMSFFDKETKVEFKPAYPHAGIRKPYPDDDSMKDLPF